MKMENRATVPFAVRKVKRYYGRKTCLMPEYVRVRQEVGSFAKLRRKKEAEASWVAADK